MGVRGRDQHLWIAEVRSERANIGAALDWMATGAAVDALNLVGDLYLAWMMVGDSEAGAARALRAIAASDGAGSPTATARAEGCAAQLLARRGAQAEAVTLARRAVARIEGGAEVDVVEVTSILGRVLIHAGRYDEGCDLLKAAEARFETLGDSWGMAMARLSIGWAEHLRGRSDNADRYVESSLESLGGSPDAWVTHAAHRLRGVVAAKGGDDASAVRHFEAALPDAQATSPVITSPSTRCTANSRCCLTGDHVGDTLVTRSARDQRMHSGSSAGSSTISACRLPFPTSMNYS